MYLVTVTNEYMCVRKILICLPIMKFKMGDLTADHNGSNVKT